MYDYKLTHCLMDCQLHTSLSINSQSKSPILKYGLDTSFSKNARKLENGETSVFYFREWIKELSIGSSLFFFYFFLNNFTCFCVLQFFGAFKWTEAWKRPFEHSVFFLLYLTFIWNLCIYHVIIFVIAIMQWLVHILPSLN